MKILALDTSEKTATAALVEDGRIIAEYSILTMTHSTTLLPMIESIFDLAGVKAKDIDLYVASVGPGSFTGIRIGVSTIKGLAFAYKTPCVGVSALEGMAYNFAGIDGIVVPVIDARRDMVYTAMFRSSSVGTVERLCDDCQIHIDELIERLSAYDNSKIYFTGDGYEKMMSHPSADDSCAYTPVKLRTPSAFGVAEAGLKIWTDSEDKSEFSSERLMPVYLRKSQAERERDERLTSGENNNNN